MSEDPRDLPKPEPAFTRGWLAFADFARFGLIGSSFTYVNPFAAKSDEHAEWAAGWREHERLAGPRPS